MRLVVLMVFFCLAGPKLAASEMLQIYTAIGKGVSLLNTASIGAAKQRKCFTCHGQGLAILAFVRAKEAGFTIDDANLQAQVDHTMRFLQSGKENYLKGSGQGGKSDMAGFALWALKEAGTPRNDTIDAVIDFLIKRKAETGHWTPAADRPPSEGSHFTSTMLALKGLESYQTEARSTEIDQRRTAAVGWLTQNQPKSTEDAVFRLWALKLAGARETDRLAAAEWLTSQQHDNGGWAQEADMDPDAYATATAMMVLLEVGSGEAAVKRGMDFLLKTQKPDGSWYVETRASPIQKYHETGFPYGEHQFISTTATGWAVLALLQVHEVALATMRQSL